MIPVCCLLIFLSSPSGPDQKLDLSTAPVRSAHAHSINNPFKKECPESGPPSPPPLLPRMVIDYTKRFLLDSCSIFHSSDSGSSSGRIITPVYKAHLAARSTKANDDTMQSCSPTRQTYRQSVGGHYIVGPALSGQSNHYDSIVHVFLFSLLNPQRASLLWSLMILPRDIYHSSTQPLHKHTYHSFTWTDAVATTITF